MKKCTFCGKTYPDAATSCAIDMMPLGPDVRKPPPPVDEKDESVTPETQRPTKKQSEPWFPIFAWLTCKREMGTGPRRLLLVISVPFFVYFIIPGIIFWLLTKVALWVISGFRQDMRLHESIETEKAKPPIPVAVVERESEGPENPISSDNNTRIPKPMTWQKLWFWVGTLYGLSLFAFFIRVTGQMGGLLFENIWRVVTVALLPAIHMFWFAVICVGYLAFKKFKIAEAGGFFATMAWIYVVTVAFRIISVRPH